MPEDTVLTFDDDNADALLHAIDEAMNARPYSTSILIFRRPSSVNCVSGGSMNWSGITI